MIKLFCAEIEKQRPVYFFTGALLFYTFISFYDWSYSQELTKRFAESGQHFCWPYFQHCSVLYLFDKPPYGYGINLFFMGVLALWFATAYFWVQRQFKWLWWGLLGLFLIKVFVAYIYSYAITASYDYYHSFFLALLLFARGRLYFLSIFIALCYLFSATLKIYPDWFSGEMFSGVGGLPIWDLIVPPSISATLLFLCFTMLPAWLFLRNHYLRFAALAIFILFHWYTAIVVGYHYPALMIPVLWALFWVNVNKLPKLSKDFKGWFLIALATLFHMWSFVIPGNEKITGEGVRYGLYMFDARRNCTSMVRENFSADFPWSDLANGGNGSRRCYVYREWFTIKYGMCRQNPDIPIEWKFSFSHNPDGPYQTLVDVPNACALEFKPFWHNEWIKTVPYDKPWWWYWVWSFWALNLALFMWIVIRLK